MEAVEIKLRKLLKIQEKLIAKKMLAVFEENETQARLDILNEEIKKLTVEFKGVF